ncbi:hypothetical protein HDV00_003257 [Rhizophlyctis rosea]|nr:hypothetical protein HDV00_003257 [Rhizophlyctis rosea]
MSQSPSGANASQAPPHFSPHISDDFEPNNKRLKTVHRANIEVAGGKCTFPTFDYIKAEGMEGGNEEGGIEKYGSGVSFRVEGNMGGGKGTSQAMRQSDEKDMAGNKRKRGSDNDDDMSKEGYQTTKRESPLESDPATVPISLATIKEEVAKEDSSPSKATPQPSLMPNSLESTSYGPLAEAKYKEIMTKYPILSGAAWRFLSHEQRIEIITKRTEEMQKAGLFVEPVEVIISRNTMKDGHINQPNLPAKPKKPKAPRTLQKEAIMEKYHVPEQTWKTMSADMRNEVITARSAELMKEGFKKAAVVEKYRMSKRKWHKLSADDRNEIIAKTNAELEELGFERTVLEVKLWCRPDQWKAMSPEERDKFIAARIEALEKRGYKKEAIMVKHWISAQNWGAMPYAERNEFIARRNVDLEKAGFSTYPLFIRAPLDDNQDVDAPKVESGQTLTKWIHPTTGEILWDTKDGPVLRGSRRRGKTMDNEADAIAIKAEEEEE